MKRRITAAALALALTALAALPASASVWFDWSVFQQAEGICLIPEDAAGETYAMVDALANGTDGQISAGEGTVRVIPAVETNEEMDLFGLVLDYRDSQARGFDQVIVVIGDNQYYFSSGTSPICQQTQLSDGTVCETLTLLLDGQSVQMMEDLEDHREDSIQVVLVGSGGIVHFELTDAMKDGILELYDLYVAAGGTRQENLDAITEVHHTAMVACQLLIE